MTMRITKIAAAALLMSGTASVALACDLPPLVAIPAKDAVGDKARRSKTETDQYFEAMKVYTACVQAELTAAGGDSAQTIMKAVLVQRNNYGRRRSPSRAQGLQRSVGKRHRGRRPGRAAPGRQAKADAAATAEPRRPARGPNTA